MSVLGALTNGRGELVSPPPGGIFGDLEQLSTLIPSFINDHEQAHISTIQAGPQASTRVPFPHGNEGRSWNHQKSPPERT